MASFPCRNRPTRSWRTLSVLASQRLFISLSGSFRQNGPRVLSRSPDIHLPACLSLRPKASRSSEVVLVSRSIAPWHFGFQHPPVHLAQLAVRARAKAQVRRLVARRLTFFRMMISRLGFPTTPGLDYEPWRLVARHVEKLDIEEYFFGSMFLASDSLVRKDVRVK